MARSTPTVREPSVARWSVAVGVLICIVLGFLAVRIRTDVPHIFDGTTPDDDFAKRYVAHPWVGYGHMLPGAVYLVGAPLQLARRFRTRHYAVHRRLGRVLLACGLLSGTLAVVLGVLFAWAGPVEGAAAAVFGGWFLWCLVSAFRAIRAGDVPQHRRWMIRAFAVGLGVATIRIWVGLFTGVQIGLLGMGDDTFPVRATFGVAFWLGLGLHVLAGECWLRRTPALDG